MIATWYGLPKSHKTSEVFRDQNSAYDVFGKKVLPSGGTFLFETNLPQTNSTTFSNQNLKIFVLLVDIRAESGVY